MVQTLNSFVQILGITNFSSGQAVMILLCLILVYLAVKKNFEPLLFLPIGIGGILSNIPLADISAKTIFRITDGSLFHQAGGFIGQIYGFGIDTALFPILIFLGIGALTDFGPLIANPKTVLLGVAAQFAIFSTLIGALLLGKYFGFDFNTSDAASIGIIGGVDGTAAIFLAGKLSPRLIGPITLAAYSYMALAPVIQPPIIRLLTTKKERSIKMEQLRHVSKREKILFPLIVLGLFILFLPAATPLIGALMFGNLLKESGVTERLSRAASHELLSTVTILLGLAIGSSLSADRFLHIETLAIFILGLITFPLGTAFGIFMGKLMNLFLKKPVNPLIGAAGFSAAPKSARIVNQIGIEANPQNYLLMHAMGPNLAGIIGSIIAAGILLSIAPVLGS